MISKINYLLIFLCLAFPVVCTANTINLSGSSPTIPTKRSLAGNWTADSGLNLAAENTLADPHKIVIEATLINPPAWQGRYLRVSVGDQQDWWDITPGISFYDQVEIVANGISNGATDLLMNLGLGDYPPVPLIYESRANTDALPGSAQLTITISIVMQ